VEGAARFLRRLWRTVHEHLEATAPAPLDTGALNEDQRDLRHRIHATIRKVSDDVGRRYKFNTAVAACRELINALANADDHSPQGRALARETLDTVVLMLAPVVPHICHALWQALGHDTAVIDADWPQAEAAALARAEVDVVVQVNGKLRGKIRVPVDAEQEAVASTALKVDNVARFVEDRPIRKMIYVPGRLLNIVV